MRLVFSSTSHLNTNISDERGSISYTISTPLSFPFLGKKVTTIAKKCRSGVPETIATIESDWLTPTVIRFDGREVLADTMLVNRSWFSHSRCFTGPNGRVYKWKMEPSHSWMKDVQSTVQLVRFHEMNFGIMKPSHPPYLDVSPRVVPMLDHIILTFACFESQRQATRRNHRR